MDRRVCRFAGPWSDVDERIEFAYYSRIQRGRACMSQAATEGCRGGLPLIYISDGCEWVCVSMRWSRAGCSVISSLWLHPKCMCVHSHLYASVRVCDGAGRLLIPEALA